MKKIGLIIKPDAVSEETAQAFCSGVAASFYKIDPADSLPSGGFDAIACFGGDGTFLRASTHALRFEVPLISVNTGNLGFLCSFDRSDKAAFSDAILFDRNEIVHLSVFEGLIVGKTHTDNNPFHFINDVTVERKKGELYGGSAIYASISVSGDECSTFISDGVIVSSAVGSTAYSLSAGGSVLSPDLNAAIITPICSHSLSVRPLVVPDCSDICVGLGSRSGECAVYSDGLYRGTLFGGETLAVKKTQLSVKVVRGKFNFYNKLKKWGEVR